jgi:hypothetical protein
MLPWGCCGSACAWTLPVLLLVFTGRSEVVALFTNEIELVTTRLSIYQGALRPTSLLSR